MSGEWAAFQGHQQGVWLRLAFVDLVGGDIPAALVLAQLSYWDSGGRGRTVEIKGKRWRVQPHSAWWNECRLERKAAIRAINVLKDFGYVETMVCRSANAPTVHIRLIEETLNVAVSNLDEHPEEPPSPAVRPDMGRTADRVDMGRSKKVPNRDEPSYTERSKHENPCDDPPPADPAENRSEFFDSVFQFNAGFDAFWKAYPLKKDKGSARKAWKKAIKSAPFQIVIDGATRYRDDPNRDPNWTKHPATWLNAEAWDNPAEPSRNGTGPTGTMAPDGIIYK